MSLRLSASPEELCRQFYSLRTAKDVADLLDIDLPRLYYHIYIVPNSSKYTTFDIPKKSGGGSRSICAPITPLKIIQRKLNQVLQHVYPGKPPVHGFIPHRSILTNAKVHTRRRHILNIDLRDFFPSINFGRVRGLFMGTPYKISPPAATVLAQICCFDNQLPQGAPTSPIVSNMVCAKMDSQLMALAQENRCDYTRYADDITFSTNLSQFPSALATISSIGQIEMGAEVVRIITQNGFEVNPNKVRLQGRDHRQEVTGLITNRFPNVRRSYVRRIRGMLHAWEKFGLQAAEKEFRSHHGYNKKHQDPQKTPTSFKKVVKGKIDFLGMVRGKRDSIYLRLVDRLRVLAPELVKQPVTLAQDSSAIELAPLVYTEGKSDWKHIKAAIQRLKELGHYTYLNIEFVPLETSMGDTELLKMCNLLSKTPQPKTAILIFDRDNPSIMKDVASEGEEYKSWGNKVFSFAIPVPTHRQGNPSISIEFFYTDEELKRQDSNGRRLFLSNEFVPKSGRHKKMDVICHNLKKIGSQDISIIDNGVIDKEHKNIALSKDDFAEYVLNRTKNFDNFDFSQFQSIFDVIVRIMRVGQP